MPKSSPPCHQKIKCSVLDYIQLLMISWVIWAMKVDWNVKKGPLCHQKIKCSFLDYVQLLMIGQAIQAKNIDRNAKKTKKRPPKSSKNKMFSFWITFNFNDQRSNPSKKRQLKCKKNKKGLPKSLKNKMFIFGLHSTSDDRPSDSEQKMLTEMQNNKKGPWSHQKIKCSFLDYIQLLMISQVSLSKKWSTEM